jgi:hypothetical protein
MMGDHFWPAVYPGIAVGLLYGLSLGGVRNIVVASLGGLVAAFLAFTLLPSFFAEDGLVPLAALLAVSFAGAYAVVRAAAAAVGTRSAD